MEYHHPGSHAKKCQNLGFGRKTHATVFWDADGVIFAEFLEPATTFNPESYTATLKTLMRQLRRVWSHKFNIWLKHDNIGPHTWQTIVEATEKLCLTILPHLLYGQDLAQCDFHLFPGTEEDVCGHLCDLDEEVERTVRTWMMKENVEFSFVTA